MSPHYLVTSLWSVIMLTSCTVTQLGMVLQGRWNRWSWLSQKGQNALTYFCHCDKHKLPVILDHCVWLQKTEISAALLAPVARWRTSLIRVLHWLSYIVLHFLSNIWLTKNGKRNFVRHLAIHVADIASAVRFAGVNDDQVAVVGCWNLIQRRVFWLHSTVLRDIVVTCFRRVRTRNHLCPVDIGRSRRYWAR